MAETNAGNAADNRNRETDMNALKRACALLMERDGFEAVQIFATREVGSGETRDVSCGSGNFFARVGQVKQWVEYQDEIVRCQARATVEVETEDEESED